MGIFSPSPKKMLWRIEDSLRGQGHTDLDPRVVDLSLLPGYSRIGSMGVPAIALSLDLYWRTQLCVFIKEGMWGYAIVKIVDGPSSELGDVLKFGFAPVSKDITHEILQIVEDLRETKGS